MFTALLIIYVIICLFLILTVLLQAGKGGGMGIGVGSAGGSQSVFGGSGAGNFLTRLTGGAATAFILLSLVLAKLSSAQDSPRLRELAAQQAAAEADEKASREKYKEDLSSLGAADSSEESEADNSASSEAAEATQGVASEATDDVSAQPSAGSSETQAGASGARDEAGDETSQGFRKFENRKTQGPQGRVAPEADE